MKDRAFIWAIAAVWAIGIIGYYTAKVSSEDSKQKAFMMKACVDAGGQWKKNWGPTWDCIRPENRP